MYSKFLTIKVLLPYDLSYSTKSYQDVEHHMKYLFDLDVCVENHSKPWVAVYTLSGCTGSALA